jgi:rRNA maturation protein Nop10
MFVKMQKLKKCKNCKIYTLKEFCEKCKSKTKDAHYKFIRKNNLDFIA